MDSPEEERRSTGWNTFGFLLIKPTFKVGVRESSSQQPTADDEATPATATPDLAALSAPFTQSDVCKIGNGM